jgi:hypothetical protein
MAKSRETFLKVADTFKKQGDKFWASAKNDGPPSDFNKARTAYATAEKARQSAQRLDDE